MTLNIDAMRKKTKGESERGCYQREGRKMTMDMDAIRGKAERKQQTWMMSEGRQKGDTEYGCYERETRKEALHMGAFRGKAERTMDMGAIRGKVERRH